MNMLKCIMGKHKFQWLLRWFFYLFVIGIATPSLALGATIPEWWINRGVLLPNTSPDDYAVANLGQLRRIAKLAYDEISSLPGGADVELDALVASPAFTGGDNYAVVTLGQVKKLAKPFYDWLNRQNVSMNYPWLYSNEFSSDYAVVNIGQLKRIFSFEISDNALDSDEDGLRDWEESLIGTSSNDTDSDDDLYGDYYEVIYGLNPNNFHSFGAPAHEGVFRVYAPNAKAINLILAPQGDWGNVSSYDLTRESGRDYWSTRLNTSLVAVGDEFKYVIIDPDRRIDPTANYDSNGFTAMNLAGNFTIRGWDISDPSDPEAVMQLIDDRTWELIYDFQIPTENIEFKFVANNSWSPTSHWGVDLQIPPSQNILYERTGKLIGDDNFKIQNHVFQGQYRFTFNEETLLCSVVKNELWKPDPRARQFSGGDTLNSVVTENNTFTWTDDNFVPPGKDELILYEVHIGSFGRNNNDCNYTGTIQDISDKLLNHIVPLGVNAIEIMPVTEFNTTTSLGFNPATYFSFEQSYLPNNEKDIIKFKEFVNTCHLNGIAVILDVDINKLGNQPSYGNPEGMKNPIPERKFPENQRAGTPLVQYDYLSNIEYDFGDYFYLYDPSNTSKQFAQYGGLAPNYDTPAVWHYVMDSLIMWINEYHIDGFRFDVADALPKEFRQKVNALLKKHTGKFSFAESKIKHHYNYLFSSPPEGLGFDFAWGGGLGHLGRDWDPHHIFIYYIQMRNEDVQEGIFNRIYRDEDEHSDDFIHKQISFSTHNTVKNLGHFMTLLKDKSPSQPNLWYQQRASIMSCMNLFGSRIPYFFMGEEFFTDTVSCRNSNIWKDDGALPWDYLQSNDNIVEMYRHLISLLKNEPTKNGLRGNRATQTLGDTSKDIVVIHKYNDNIPNSDVILIWRFSEGDEETDYELGVPLPGNWKEQFKSSWYIPSLIDPTPVSYPSQEVEKHGFPDSITISIPSHCAIILSNEE